MTILDKVLIGKIYDAHGIRGLVKIKTFIQNPKSFCDYTPIVDDKDNIYDIEFKNITGKPDIIIAKLNNINDRTSAEQLKGTLLYTNRSSIINDDNDILINELKDFKVIDENDNNVGIVKDILNYGAGDILEIIMQDNKSALLSMNEYSIKEINKQKEYIKIDRTHMLES